MKLNFFLYKQTMNTFDFFIRFFEAWDKAFFRKMNETFYEANMIHYEIWKFF